MQNQLQSFEFFTPEYQVNKLREKEDEYCEGATFSPFRDNLDWSQSQLQIQRFWRFGTGKGVKVAVLDTGVDPDHPDLKEAIDEVKDFTGEGIEDENGHGTHCAGVIGARRNNDGVVGVAPDCRLYIAKVLSNKGGGSHEWIASAIEWAVEKGVDIISMSLGGPVSTDRMFESVHTALAKGVCIIAAAGNEGAVGSNTIGYPGRYGSLITIGASDSNGNKSGFSSSGGEIDFLAPGSNIYSAYSKGRYASLSGTSMATPFAAGLSAIIHQRRHIENCEQLRNELMKMATHPGWHDNNRGYGLLQPMKYFS